MEILDPNTRSCTFLTLTKYVGEKGAVEPAICSMRKDEAFLDSTNTFVAAESWRLSCAPNPQGIVYHWIPKEYWISVSTKESSGDHGKQEDKTNITSMTFENILQDKVALPDKQMLHMVPLQPDDIKENEVDVNEICVTMFKDLNASRVTLNSKVTLNNANNENGYYIMKEDPYKKLRGPAYGLQGITSMRGRYKSNRDRHDNTPALPNDPGAHLNTIRLRFMKFIITKATIPYISLEDLMIFFSQGVCFWRDYSKTSTTGELPYYVCNGPIYIETSDATMTYEALNHNRTPIHQLYTDAGDYFRKGGTVYQRYLDPADNKQKVKSATVTSLYNSQWAFETQNGEYLLYLAVTPTAEGVAHNTAYNGNPLAYGEVGDDFFYYPYVHSEQLEANTRNLYTKIKSACEIEMFAPDPTDPTKFVPSTAANVPGAAATPILVHALTSKTVIKRQATRGAPIPSYTPNDFMQWFNSGFGKEPQPYVITTSPNGGWRLVVLEDGLSNLSISKAMCDSMGLLPYMIVDGIENTSNKITEKHPVVFNITPDKQDPQHWYWNWQGNYNFPAGLHNPYFKYDVNDFVIINSLDGTEGAPLTYDTPVIDPNTGKAHFLYHRTIKNYFRLVAFEEKQVVTTDVSTGQVFPQIDYDEYDNAFYSYDNPHKGAFIDNDQTVSIGSFSVFEGIRIIVPSGIAFAPQLSSHSNERVLCSLRLPFQNSAEIQQGFIENKPVVMSTESAFYGDVLWNAPPSGLQYLPLTIADAGIYDIEVAVELIARDPEIPPQRVYLGYTDIFQIKLRFITRN